MELDKIAISNATSLLTRGTPVVVSENDGILGGVLIETKGNPPVHAYYDTVRKAVRVRVVEVEDGELTGKVLSPSIGLVAHLKNLPASIAETAMALLDRYNKEYLVSIFTGVRRGDKVRIEFAAPMSGTLEGIVSEVWDKGSNYLFLWTGFHEGSCDGPDESFGHCQNYGCAMGIPEVCIKSISVLEKEN